MALPDGLLKSVKNYLDITWELGEAGDEKLSGIVARGIFHIDGIVGIALDYTKEENARELLMDYCRYVRSNALDEFDKNYEAELLGLQNAIEIKYWAGLTALAIGTIEITPVFDVSTKEYTAETANASDVLTVTPAQSDALVEIINGATTVENGTSATWADGENTVVISVTCGKTTNAYTIVVTKA